MVELVCGVLYSFFSGWLLLRMRACGLTLVVVAQALAAAGQPDHAKLICFSLV
jgi:hypothetical protein